LQASFATWVSTANVLLREISDAKSSDDKLSHTMLLANQVLSLITNEPLREPSDIVGENILTLQNSERYDAWFQPHPFFEGTRSVFDLFEGANPGIQAKLYWLKKRSNALMAGAVHFTPNWEDAEWSRNDNYKIGIDFFLSPDGSAMHVVLSDLGKLRVLELRERLTNTDVEVLEKWFRASEIATKDELHAALWESFKLQAVNAKFYRGIADAFTELHEHLLGLGKPDKDSKMFSSRLLGRLIFVWFIRKLSLINKDVEYFEPYGIDPSAYYRGQLERLFFRTFNTPVNERVIEEDGTIDLVTPFLSGGLFEPRLDDWVGQGVTFPQDFFTRLYDHFSDFNFTTDESTPDYEQVAIDPEMLGQVFESLLASQIESTGEQARKAKGAFYTPREIVQYMCREAVRSFLLSLNEEHGFADSVEKLIDTSDQEWAQASSNKLSEIPLDHRLEIKSGLVSMRTLDPACGSGAFPLGLLKLLASIRLRLEPSIDVYTLKLEILQNNIFGSDIEPMAVEISKLRSWLSLIVDRPGLADSVSPLPNLDFNFVSADTLRYLQEADLFTDPSVQSQLEVVRQKYFAATDPKAKQDLQEKYKKLSSPDLIDARSNQLRTFNPFDSESVADFYDLGILFGVDVGFDVVIGNPPYEVLQGHHWQEFLALIKREGRYKRAIGGKLNLYRLFIERAQGFLAKDGVLSFIVPSTLIADKSAMGIRSMMRSKCTLRFLIEFPEKERVFQAVTQATTIFQVTNGHKNIPFKLAIGLSSAQLPPKSSALVTWEQIEAISGADLTLPLVKSNQDFVLLEKIKRGKIPLRSIANSYQGDVNLTVVKASLKNEDTGTLILRGEHVSPYLADLSSEDPDRRWITTTHMPVGSRVERIVCQQVANMGLSQRIVAAKVPAGIVVGNSCNVVQPKGTTLDQDELVAILNSKLMNWYFMKFSTNNHVNVYELDELPMPNAVPEKLGELSRQISELSQKAIVDFEEIARLRELIDTIVFESYGLDDQDISTL
jgi:Alw26I/Eco31I/Esp3I family type II restriction m6 adenine DNA methyltransferase